MSRELDELDSLFRNVIGQEKDGSQSMAQVYWLHLFDDRIDPATRAKNRVKYRVYLSFTYDLNYPEYALPLELIYEFRNRDSQRNDVVNGLFKEAYQVKNEEKAYVFLSLMRYQKPEYWRDQITLPTIEVGKACDSLMSLYVAEIDSLILAEGVILLIPELLPDKVDSSLANAIEVRVLEALVRAEDEQ